MDQTQFFEAVVEPSAERLGLFRLSHDVKLDGRAFTVVHTISKHVFTGFDVTLSRYLAAVTGRGLPGATVRTRIRDKATERDWMPYPARHVASVPHALATAAKLALGSNKSVTVQISSWTAEGEGAGREMKITTETLETLERALRVCDDIGSVDFLEISGDFERVLVRPVDSKLAMMSMDLFRGSVTVPGVTGDNPTGWQGPMHGFEKAIGTSPEIGAFMGRARHEVSKAKEDAIHAFREAAENRIMHFDAALAGRELKGYRLESATTLVARLQAGLGDSLLGLSEAAQMTALDWAAQVRDMPKKRRERGAERSREATRRPRLVSTP